MASRREITEAAAALFRERGYHRTSMADIARRVGLLKGSLYYHIESKEEILFEILDGFIDLLIAKTEARAAAPAPDQVVRLEGMIADFLEIIRDYTNELTIFFNERRNLSGARWERINAKRARFGALLLDAIRAGQREGSLRADLDPTIVMLGMFGMVNWAIYWLKPEGRLSLSEIASILSRILFDGLRAPARPASPTRRRKTSPARAGSARRATRA
ncbi:MAG: TetR/AcrR family transcriptional regulator [Thermoflexales bacterium]|nr:TetR/AcrR family transcriptional regulator [Thermoflexales bacterium]